MYLYYPLKLQCVVGNGCYGCYDTHIRWVEAEAQRGVYNEGENSGECRDDAGDAGINILDITDPLHLFLLCFP